MAEWLTLDTTQESYTWWVSLVTVAGISVTLFLVVFYFTRNYPKEEVPRWSKRYSFWMRILAFPYVFECVWRSFFPGLYNWRRTFFDTPLNAVLVNRSLAFVGEVCWGIQIGWALAVLGANMPLREGAPTGLLRKVIPVIGIYIGIQAFVSNIFSLLGLATTSNFYNVLEEIGWLLIFTSALFCASITLYFSTDGGLCGDDDHDGIRNFMDSDVAPSTRVMRWFLRGIVVFGLGAIPYMCIEDIPKYYQRWREEVADSSIVYFSVGEGLADAFNTRNQSQDWDDWKQDWLWMSLYFSFGCWSSIALMYAPGRLQRGSEFETPALALVGQTIE